MVTSALGIAFTDRLSTVVKVTPSLLFWSSMDVNRFVSAWTEKATMRRSRPKSKSILHGGPVPQCHMVAGLESMAWKRQLRGRPLHAELDAQVWSEESLDVAVTNDTDARVSTWGGEGLVV